MSANRGISVGVTPGFLLTAAGAVLLTGLETVVAVAAAALIHELGHVFAVFICGGRIRNIRFELSGISIEAVYGRALGYAGEIFCAASGPGANILAGVLLAFNARDIKFIYLLSGANILLGAFNLLPAGRFDGGSILKSLLGRFLPPLAAHRGFRFVSVLFGTGILAGGIFLFIKSGMNVTLLLCGLFLSARLILDERPSGRRLPGREKNRV